MRKTIHILIMLMTVAGALCTTTVMEKTGSNILVKHAGAFNATEWDQINSSLNLLWEQTRTYLNLIWGALNVTSDNVTTILAVLGDFGANETIKTHLVAINETLVIEDVSNDTVTGKLNAILKRIEGTGASGTNWSLYDTQNYILRGLIDKDENYILHNGTLATLEGSSVLKAIIANQGVLSNQDGMLAELMRNSTQEVIDVSDENKQKLQENQGEIGEQIINSHGTILWVCAFTLIIVIFYLLWKIKLKDMVGGRAGKHRKGSDIPPCFGDPKVYNAKECEECSLIDGCRKEVLKASAAKEKQDCFGQYLATSAECKKCREAEDCRKVTPGGEIHPADEEKKSIVSVNPLEGL